MMILEVGSGHIAYRLGEIAHPPSLDGGFSHMNKALVNK